MSVLLKKIDNFLETSQMESFADLNFGCKTLGTLNDVKCNFFW